MDVKHKEVLQKCRRFLTPLIEEADTNPDKWYELFITHNDGSTESVESGDTFTEVTKDFDNYCDLYGAENVSVDIWQNRNTPEPIHTNPNDLRDGESYNILLKSGYTIKKTIYHYCALSGKHYFAKGDEVYPIEDVHSHSMRPMSDNNHPQVLTMTYYGHEIDVTLTPDPYCKLEFVPDSVKEVIFELLESDNTTGEFTDDEAEDYVDDETYCTFSGSWRIIQLNHNFMLRVARWVRNYGPDEGLTKELFGETYGSVMGDHYLTKWENVYPHNIIAMIAYFGNDTKEGQLFCDMIYKQMLRYENRINE